MLGMVELNFVQKFAMCQPYYTRQNGMLCRVPSLAHDKAPPLPCASRGTRQTMMADQRPSDCQLFVVCLGLGTRQIRPFCHV